MPKLAMVMDPINSIKPHKDSSFAMLLSAQKRGYETHYFTADQLYIAGDLARAKSQVITVRDQRHDWFSLAHAEHVSLHDFDVILMRKDPPFDMEYIMDTYILEHASSKRTHVINKPQALRDANEKFFTESFPAVSYTHLTLPTIYSV